MMVALLSPFFWHVQKALFHGPRAPTFQPGPRAPGPVEAGALADVDAADEHDFSDDKKEYDGEIPG
jgi:hypothetical protein